MPTRLCVLVMILAPAVFGGCSKRPHVATDTTAGGRAAGSSDQPREEAAEKFIDGMQGKWQLVSRVAGGEPSDPGLVKARTITVKGDRYTLKDGGTVVTELRFSVDTTKDPVHFDVVPLTGPGRGQVERGIIKMEGDRMTFCTGPSGGGRPPSFESPRSRNFLLAEYRRVKE